MGINCNYDGISSNSRSYCGSNYGRIMRLEKRVEEIESKGLSPETSNYAKITEYENVHRLMTENEGLRMDVARQGLDTVKLKDDNKYLKRQIGIAQGDHRLLEQHVGSLKEGIKHKTKQVVELKGDVNHLLTRERDLLTANKSLVDNTLVLEVENDELKAEVTRLERENRVKIAELVRSGAENSGLKDEVARVMSIVLGI